MMDLYVDTDNGDPYNTGTAWEDAMDNLLHAVWLIPDPLDYDYLIHCRGIAEDTSGGIVIYATANGYSLTIQCDPADRHPGHWDENKYRITSTGNAKTLQLSMGVTLIGLQVGYGNGGWGISFNSQDDYTVEKCIVRQLEAQTLESYGMIAPLGPE